MTVPTRVLKYQVLTRTDLKRRTALIGRIAWPAAARTAEARLQDDFEMPPRSYAMLQLGTK